MTSTLGCSRRPLMACTSRPSTPQTSCVTPWTGPHRYAFPGERIQLRFGKATKQAPRVFQ
jgi:hypothetical protein